MAAQPRTTRRPRPHVRVLGWLAAAALVALALLPGARVHEAYGSAQTQIPPERQLTAEASPTPTPEGSPTPDAASTPTPDPSPTPTPVATPTPSPTPTRFRERISAQKIIDGDGNVDTENDQSLGEGWEFELTLTDGTVNEAHPITDSSGWAGWQVSFGPGGASATLTEVAQEGFDLLDIECIEIGDSGDSYPGVRDGHSVTFEVDLPDGSIKCYFFNTPSQGPVEEVTASVNAYPVLDQDGDPATRWGVDWLPMQGWQFVADFGDAKVDVAHPVADEFGDAWWYITYENDTQIEITESVADGYRLVDVECGWAPDEETVERLPVKRDSNSVSWTAVVGTVGYHDFWCAFVNVVEGPTALPTLPPTDAATHSAVVGQDAWRRSLVCLAGVLGAVLVIGSRRSTQARRSVRA